MAADGVPHAERPHSAVRRAALRPGEDEAGAGARASVVIPSPAHRETRADRSRTARTPPTGRTAEAVGGRPRLPRQGSRRARRPRPPHSPRARRTARPGRATPAITSSAAREAKGRPGNGPDGVRRPACGRGPSRGTVVRRDGNGADPPAGHRAPRAHRPTGEPSVTPRPPSHPAHRTGPPRGGRAGSREPAASKRPEPAGPFALPAERPSGRPERRRATRPAAPSLPGRILRGRPGRYAHTGRGAEGDRPPSYGRGKRPVSASGQAPAAAAGSPTTRRPRESTVAPGLATAQTAALQTSSL